MRVSRSSEAPSLSGSRHFWITDFVNRAKPRIVVDLKAINLVNLDLRAATLDILRKRKCPGGSESLILETFNSRGRRIIRDLRKSLVVGKRRKSGSFETPRVDLGQTSKEGARTGVHGRGARSSQRTHNALLRSGVLHEG